MPDPKSSDEPARRALLSGGSAALRWAAAAFVIALLGAVDVVTGPEIALSIFYLGPVAWASWGTSRLNGMALAVVGASVWYAADRLGDAKYTHNLIPVWNAMVRLSFFAVSVETLARLKASLDLSTELAHTDTVTGIANARAFKDAVCSELARAQRYGGVMTIAYIDVDNFKKINDTLGHDVGDSVLRKVSQTMRTHLRRVDLPARLGGDEFGILLPHTDADAARSAVDKVQQQLSAAAQREGWPISFSIGVASFTTPPASFDATISCADQLMYEVKRGGKNSVRYASY